MSNPTDIRNQGLNVRALEGWTRAKVQLLKYTSNPSCGIISQKQNTFPCCSVNQGLWRNSRICGKQTPQKLGSKREIFSWSFYVCGEVEAAGIVLNLLITYPISHLKSLSPGRRRRDQDIFGINGMRILCHNHMFLGYNPPLLLLFQ